MATPANPLPPALRARLERALAADLSAVRVGEDPEVAAMGARAVASGTTVVFAPGAYAPDTEAGEALIAHEVVHLVQQAEGRVAATGTVDGAPINTERGLEQEADDLAARALRGEAVRSTAPSLATTGPIQGFFGDFDALEDLINPFVDPLVDAASELWNKLTDDDAPAAPTSGKLHVGDVVLVTDPDALVRDRAAGWTATGAEIPIGTSVTVAELDGKYARVVGVDGTEWGWTKKSNLGHDKSKGGPKGPDEPKTPETPKPVDPKAPPELPKTDEEWQELIAESRAAVDVDQHFAVTSKTLNPELLFAVRRCGFDPKDPFYDVLTHKEPRKKGHKPAQPGASSHLTPALLAKRLGEALMERAGKTESRPRLLAEKLAKIDKVAPTGTVDISHGAGGNLRAGLGKDLAPAASAAISTWIKAHYEGKNKRLVLDPTEVAELRAVVTDAVDATTNDPALDARIELWRADVAACETRVRELLRTNATDAKNEKNKALWGKLADIAETDGVFVERELTAYTFEHEDGSHTSMHSILGTSRNLLNPGGFKNGGGQYSEKTMDSVLTEVYAGDPEQAAKADATKRFIRTLNRNEGGPDSMNTWDGELVSAGPGLSGSGRLQASMFAFKAEDPAGFHDALGKFGVDIKNVVEREKNGKKVLDDVNPYFIVRVPTDVTAIPPAMIGKVTPGEVIIGSSSTGAKKTSSTYKECRALRYISNDPILLSRFMYAGEHSYQRFLIKEATRSMQAAGKFSFLVGSGETAIRVSWRALIEPLGADWLAATEAVIAYRYHASAKTYENLKVKAASFYTSRFGADRDPTELTDDERKQMGRFVAWQLNPKKYGVYRAQFPSVANDVFPPAPEPKGKGKTKDEPKAEDDDDDTNDPDE